MPRERNYPQRRLDNVSARASFKRGVHYMPIDGWCEEKWEQPGEPPCAQLEYAETVEVFGDVFGKAFVDIFLDEQFVEDPDQHIARICKIIGIDAEERCFSSQS